MVRLATVFFWQAVPRKVGRPVFRPNHPTQTPVVTETQRYASQDDCMVPVMPEWLFVAKSKYWNLWECLPHAITNMYALVTEHKWV